MGRVLLYICGAFVLVVGAEIAVLYMMFHGYTGTNRTQSCMNVQSTPDKRIAACTELIKWDVAHHYRSWQAVSMRGTAYIDKGDAEGLQGDNRGAKAAYEHAVADYSRILRWYPHYGEALNNRCWARELAGESLNLALQDCNKAIAVEPRSYIFQSRAQVYLSMGDFTRAIADSNAALKQQPRMASALIVRGIAETRAGSHVAGASDISAATAISPDIAPLYRSYGLLPPEQPTTLKK